MSGPAPAAAPSSPQQRLNTKVLDVGTDHRIGPLTSAGESLLLRLGEGPAFDIILGSAAIRAGRRNVLPAATPQQLCRYSVNEDGDGVLQGFPSPERGISEAWRAEFHLVTLPDGTRILDLVVDEKRIVQLRLTQSGTPLAVGYDKPFPPATSRATMPLVTPDVIHYTAEAPQNDPAEQQYKQGSYNILCTGQGCSTAVSVRSQADRTIALYCHTQPIDIAIICAFIAGRQWL